LTVRPARPDDAEQIARIYNQGIEERVATFQTETQSPPEIAEQITHGGLELVAERDGRVVAWASVGPYDDAHEYYSGICEATLYVDRSVRRGGTGRALLNALAQEAERRGYYKLVGKIFTSNEPSIALVRSCGWREVGVHCRHGRLDGKWKDVLVVERLLGEALWAQPPD
jgi:phosphinothricin acetyltransferase